MQVYVRYDLPNKKFKDDEGNTEMLSRRQWYPRFDRKVPPLEIPEEGEYLWEWYMDMTSRIRRVVEGVCVPITPTDWLGWQQITGNEIRPAEHRILGLMDIAFCEEMNKELEGRREAHREEMEQKAKRKR